MASMVMVVTVLRPSTMRLYSMSTTRTSACRPSAMRWHWTHSWQGAPLRRKQLTACAISRASVSLPTWGGPVSR